MSTLKNGIAAFLWVSLMLLAPGVLASSSYIFPNSFVGPANAPAQTGSSELVISRLLKLYPNPNATDALNIKGFEKNTPAAIFIKNAIGYTVTEEKTYVADDKGEINVNIQSLQQGHYYIGIKVGKTQVIKKMIKI